MKAMLIGNCYDSCYEKTLSRCGGELHQILGCDCLAETELPAPATAAADLQTLQREAHGADVVIFLPWWWLSRRARLLNEYCRFTELTTAYASCRRGRWRLLVSGQYMKGGRFWK
ncbi:MAG: hypothetical protein IKQ73_07435 [Oscillospiraceae bacterium]|nr:hypothetical protein [Oscillospiraceae bacterium]